MYEEKIIWKQYPDYPFIEANQFGEIRTIDRFVTCRDGRKRLVKGRVLKQRLDRGGYLRVHISINGREVDLLAHRVIASAFIPNPNNLPEVNHRDNNPRNNRVSNLEWCTSQYNTAYREKCGTSASKALGRSVIAVNL